MRVEKIGETFEAGDAGVLIDFFVVATGLNNGFEFASGQSREIEVKILVFEGGKSLNAGISVSKVKGNGVGEVVSV